MEKKRLNYLYIIIVMLVCLVPLVLIKFAGMQQSTENKDKLEFPELSSKGKLNSSYLTDMGAWFEENFAFRQQMVSFNGKLMSDLFGVSQTSEIVTGKDGWLFTSLSLDDYRGTNQYSDRKIFNMAHNVSLMQKSAEAQGRKFIFTVPANKNSLYGEYMPYYYKEADSASNLERLSQELLEMDINYVDLYSLFKSSGETLYLKRDSHWNNDGAKLAYNAIMDAGEIPHNTYSSAEKEVRCDYVGDLADMIYPELAKPEENQYYKPVFNYEFVSEDAKVDSDFTRTVSASGSGSLLMYRDSFTNTLMPFMAGEFSQAAFSKYQPYYLERDTEKYDPDVIIIELVERNIGKLADKAPAMEAPKAEGVAADTETESSTTFHSGLIDGLFMAMGSIDKGFVTDDSLIYAEIKGDNGKSECYEAFCISSGESDYDYQFYLRPESVPEGEVITNILVKNGDKTVCVKTDKSVWKDGDTPDFSAVKEEPIIRDSSAQYAFSDSSEFRAVGSKDGEAVFILNNSDKDITEIQIRKSGEKKWGIKLLGGESIAVSEKVRLSAPFERNDDSEYDFNITYKGGKSQTVSGVPPALLSRPS